MQSPSPNGMNERRTFQGVFVVSLCVLMLRLALTRLFSATMYYCFAFLAISLALFGELAWGRSLATGTASALSFLGYFACLGTGLQ